jgi:hypothetical protein
VTTYLVNRYKIYAFGLEQKQVLLRPYPGQVLAESGTRSSEVPNILAFDKTFLRIANT